MSIAELAKSTSDFFAQVLKQKCRVISIIADDKSWKATCEVEIDPEYTTRKGMGDIVEIYEVFLDDHLGVTGFAKIETKRKAEIDND
jgi:hypothetical protein